MAGPRQAVFSHVVEAETPVAPAPAPASRATRLGPTFAIALSAGWHAVLFASLIAGSSRPASGALPASVAELQFQDIEPLAVEPPMPEPVRAPDPPAPKLVRASKAARAEPPSAPAPPAAPAPAPAAVSAPAPVVAAPMLAAPTAPADSGAVAMQAGVAQAASTSAPIVARASAAPAPAPRAPVVLGTGVGVDRSRPPGLAGAARWDCPFPSEADDAGVESALVTLQVQVRPDGQLEGVRVVDDPGHGFGREARRCALQKRWQPGLGKDGATIAAAATVNVRFVR